MTEILAKFKEVLKFIESGLKHGNLTQRQHTLCPPPRVGIGSGLGRGLKSSLYDSLSRKVGAGFVGAVGSAA